MGRLDGKVALVTGAARGQGRSHAVTFAREGAQIVATDLCAPLPDTPYPAATREDLEETVSMVEALDQRCLAIRADASDVEAMRGVVDSAIEEFGAIDILHVNHGVTHLGTWESTTEQSWDLAIRTMLSGAWRTSRLVVPKMIEQGRGSIIFTSSSATTRSYCGLLAYSAAKWGIVGLMRALAAELAGHGIRVNAIAPGAVGTKMAEGEYAYEVFTGREGATREEAAPVVESLAMMPVAWLDPVEISNAALFLASDESRYITGVNLPVDAGTAAQPPGVPVATTERIAELEAQAQASGAGSDDNPTEQRG